MWFWNRVELYCGFSMKEFSELRNALAAENIKYEYRMVNYNTKSRGRIRQPWLNSDYETQYYLYVHQKDYEKAMYLTSNRNKD